MGIALDSLVALLLDFSCSLLSREGELLIGLLLVGVKCPARVLVGDLDKSVLFLVLARSGEGSGFTLVLLGLFGLAGLFEVLLVSLLSPLPGLRGLLVDLSGLSETDVVLFGGPIMPVLCYFSPAM